MHNSRTYLFLTFQQTRNLLHSLVVGSGHEEKSKNPRQGAGEIAHCLRELVVLPENQSLVPCTYIQWLTATSYSSAFLALGSIYVTYT